MCVLDAVRRGSNLETWGSMHFTISENFWMKYFVCLPIEFLKLFDFVNKTDEVPAHFRASVDEANGGLYALQALWPTSVAQRVFGSPIGSPSPAWWRLPVCENSFIHLKPPFEFIYCPTIEENRIL